MSPELASKAGAAAIELICERISSTDSSISERMSSIEVFMASSDIFCRSLAQLGFLMIW